MPVFRHNRTGRQVVVGEGIAPRYRNNRWAEEQTAAPVPVVVPAGTVAELLAWAGDDGARRDALLAAERAGKNRKSLIEALS